MAEIVKDITEEILDSFIAAQFGEAVEYRKRAIAALKQTGLPNKKSEEYRFTPIAAALEKNFTWKNKISSSKIGSIEKFLIPNLDCNLLVFINGSFSKELSKIISPPSQIQIKNLVEAFRDDTELLATTYDKLTSRSVDPFTLLNTAFWQEGIFVNIPADTSVEKPIHVVHLCDGEHEQVIAHSRLLALIGKNSKVSLIETFHSTGSYPSFHTISEEIFLGEGANIQYSKVQQDAVNSYQVANTFIHQEAASRVDTYTLTMDGKIIRNNLTIELDGEKCESHFNGLYLLDGNTLADNHTVVDHKKPNSFSNELYKGVMAGNSKGVFNGKIFVRPQAQKTNAFQSNRNILLSEAATINTKPQLEIWADDVKCSHGCTTGQLDEEALFYLRSRGIPLKEAQAMLLYAFTSETLKNVDNDALKIFSENLISQRLNSN